MIALSDQGRDANTITRGIIKQYTEAKLHFANASKKSSNRVRSKREKRKESKIYKSSALCRNQVYTLEIKNHTPYHLRLTKEKH